MDERNRKQLDELKKRLREKFQNMETHMDKVEYTRENYDGLFPDNKVSTPVGEVKLRNDQFKKLKRKERGNFLGAMNQTLTDPIAVINEDREGKKSKVFGKSFLDGLPDKRILMSVIDHENKGVTTHDRNINNFLNKIKTPTDLLYERQISGLGTARTDPDSLNLAISDDTQLSNNIPQSTPKINGKNDKNLRKE
jgi:hypothetical protein